MDYEEEQKGELEVLESIYEGELTGKRRKKKFYRQKCQCTTIYKHGILTVSCECPLPPFLAPAVISAESPRSFTIPVRSEKLNEEEEEDGLYVMLKFTHTEK